MISWRAGPCRANKERKMGPNRRCWVIAVVVASISLLITSSAYAQSVVATIPVGASPTGVGVNHKTSKVYVALSSSGTVSVISGATNTVVGTVTVGNNPQGIGVRPNGNKIFVANSGDSTVSVINGSKEFDRVVATIPVPAGAARFIGVNTRTNKMYVTGSGTVSVIDGDSDTVVATIGPIPNLLGLGVNSVTNKIYATSYFPLSTVTVIDGNTNSIVGTVPVGLGPDAVGVNSATNMIYIASVQSGTVDVIDGSTDTVVATVNLQGSLGGGPTGVAVNSVTNTIYVSNSIFFGPDLNTVAVIDGVTNTLVATVSLAPCTGLTPGFCQPFLIDVNDQTNQVYLGEFGVPAVAVISGP